MIPVNEPIFIGNEKKYLQECIDSKWVSSEGPFISQFEDLLSGFTGRKHSIAVSSGTAALDIAVEALGIGPGDEVILPAMTIISCATAIVKAGATPVLVDCDPLTFNMVPSEVEKKVTPRTKAILVVHLYGLSCDMDPLISLAKKNSLRIIEDFAEALGLEYRGRKCGSFGDISITSFYANKIITTGEGGMILTDDEALLRRCRSLRNLSFMPGRRFVHDELGWNYRMTNLQAALGVAQFESLEERILMKRSMGKLYTELLSGLSKLGLPLNETSFSKNIYWVYPVVLSEELDQEASDFAVMLEREGVGSRPFFWPMHQQPLFQKMGLFVDETYPVAERLARKGLYLPSGLGLSEEQLRIVATVVRKCLA